MTKGEDGYFCWERVAMVMGNVFLGVFFVMLLAGIGHAAAALFFSFDPRPLGFVEGLGVGMSKYYASALAVGVVVALYMAVKVLFMPTANVKLWYRLTNRAAREDFARRGQRW